jgi:hypothetical protein
MYITSAIVLDCMHISDVKKKKKRQAPSVSSGLVDGDARLDQLLRDPPLQRLSLTDPLARETKSITPTS